MDKVQVMITPKETALVRRIASDIYTEYCPAGEAGQVTKDDLYHYGIIGLLEAKSRYDKKKGVPWLAFAAFRIRGAMLDQLRIQPIIRLPQEKQKRVKVLKQARTELERNGRNADPAALAGKLGWSVEEVYGVLKLSPAMVPIHEDRSAGGTGDEYRGEMLVDQGANPETKAIKTQLAELIHKCLEALPSPEDRLVIVGRVLEGLKLRELAETLGCSSERVRQLQLQAQEKMKACLERHGWSEAG